MNKQDINVKELIRIFDKSSMSKLKITEGDFSIEMKKNSSSKTYVNSDELQVPIIETKPQPQISVKEADEQGAKGVKNNLPTFKSPMVGTFYKAPSPGAEPFVKIGSVVKKGQPIAIVEAMKIMNEIDAEFDCRIVDILVEDGQPVEFDMPLFSVEKI
ncbi:MAG: acetyl-CoA carboxylase biotin carboxyl carrier protein [Campylobacteraceae bacterium]|jgi:acetyl-CoA carboxylase biotin carboxyl carrier protein|nr:acetyl-CoA carboxylase biotin carboxyl carrier protein [Campylobacteraceae bacterium]